MSQIRKVPKVYAKLSDTVREDLIRLVELYKTPIKPAAAQLGIKYSTARYIIKQNRIGDKAPIRPKPLDL